MYGVIFMHFFSQIKIFMLNYKNIIRNETDFEFQN